MLEAYKGAPVGLLRGTGKGTDNGDAGSGGSVQILWSSGRQTLDLFHVLCLSVPHRLKASTLSVK